LTLDELEARLRGDACVALDTNVMFGLRELGRLAVLVRAANRAASTRIRLIVPALVHAEMLHDLRCWLAEKEIPYRAEEITKDLETKATEVVAFEAADGEGASAHIFQVYPTTKEWHAAKCLNAISHLGLLKKAAEIPGKHFPATVDWFIAGQARGRGWLLVTRDRGPEFAGLERIGCDLLKNALQRLASAGSQPGR